MTGNDSHSDQSKQRRLGFWAGALLLTFGKSAKKHTTSELYQQDFKSNTRKMGLTFHDRIRNAFRFRWMRLK